MRICKISDCGIKHYAKGYCKKHYQQILTHGKILSPKKARVGCTVSGCNGKHKGLFYG